MPVPNDLDFDPDVYLVFSVYYRAWGYVDQGPSAAEFLAEFDEQIKAVGRVLEWLYLAHPDKESPLGCTPSGLFRSLIGKSRKRSSKKEHASEQDEDTLNTIMEDALINAGHAWESSAYVLEVLYALGLVRHSQDGGHVTTNELRELVAERRQAERFWRAIKFPVEV